MRIVELGDCSMVIMKDSDDTPWFSVGKVCREASRYNGRIAVDVGQLTAHYIIASEYLYTAGRLVLFFKEDIPDRFHINDKVVLAII